MSGASGHAHRYSEDSTDKGTTLPSITWLARFAKRDAAAAGKVAGLRGCSSAGHTLRVACQYELTAAAPPIRGRDDRWRAEGWQKPAPPEDPAQSPEGSRVVLPCSTCLPAPRGTNRRTSGVDDQGSTLSQQASLWWLATPQITKPSDC